MTATGEQELPIDLDGGLRLRRSTSDDAEPLAEFNRWIHRDEGVTAPDETVGQWTRELLSGLIMGLAVGVAFFVFAAVGWGDARVAIAVALALVASCSVATAVAMILPTIFQRLGRDPAFGSGPLAPVVQDLLSIAVYFAIVSVVVF